jgi:hypothetical protein
MVLVVPIEERAAEAPGAFIAAEVLRKAGLVFEGSAVAFGARVVPRLRGGRLLDVCGRLSERVTPRSASSRAVAFAFIGPPRSACSVGWPGGTLCSVMASSNSGRNSVPVWASAMHQPTTRRLKMSGMTK